MSVESVTFDILKALCVAQWKCKHICHKEILTHYENFHNYIKRPQISYFHTKSFINTVGIWIMFFFFCPIFWHYSCSLQIIVRYGSILSTHPSQMNDKRRVSVTRSIQSTGCFRDSTQRVNTFLVPARCPSWECSRWGSVGCKPRLLSLSEEQDSGRHCPVAW